MGFEGIGEGKKTQRWSLLLGTWLVHSLAHELAASPEATKGEAVYEALPLALQRLL